MVNFLDLHAISKRFGGVVALRNVDLVLAGGRGSLPRRRKRVGQIHPHQDYRRRSPTGAGRAHRDRGSRVPAPQSGAIDCLRHSGDLSGPVAVPQSHGRRKHRGRATSRAPAGGELAHDPEQPRKRRLLASAPHWTLSRASRISRSQAGNWWRSVARWRPMRGW